MPIRKTKPKIFGVSLRRSLLDYSTVLHAASCKSIAGFVFYFDSVLRKIPVDDKVFFKN